MTQQLQENHPILEGNRNRRLAELHFLEGDAEQARNHSFKALASYRSAGERVAECSTLRLLGDIEAVYGDPSKAVEADKGKRVNSRGHPATLGMRLID